MGRHVGLFLPPYLIITLTGLSPPCFAAGRCRSAAGKDGSGESYLDVPDTFFFGHDDDGGDDDDDDDDDDSTEHLSGWTLIFNLALESVLKARKSSPWVLLYTSVISFGVFVTLQFLSSIR